MNDYAVPEKLILPDFKDPIRPKTSGSGVFEISDIFEIEDTGDSIEGSNMHFYAIKGTNIPVVPTTDTLTYLKFKGHVDTDEGLNALKAELKGRGLNSYKTITIEDNKVAYLGFSCITSNSRLF